MRVMNIEMYQDMYAVINIKKEYTHDYHYYFRINWSYSEER